MTLLESIAATSAFCIFEAILILALLLNYARRREAEAETFELSGRLINAQEQERARLARELHDDVSQRLAALAINAAVEERRQSTEAGGATMKTMKEDLTRLSDDVHALSYQLHPSVLEDLGLVDALKTECERASQICPIQLGLETREIPQKLADNVALCLFRIAQEGIRNIVRHARASRGEVSLRRLGGGLQLTISDDGAGFDASRHQAKSSLGHASMRQRASLLRGKIRIESQPGQGTTVQVWVPLT